MNKYATTTFATLVITLALTASVQVNSIANMNDSYLETEFSKISQLDSSKNHVSDTSPILAQGLKITAPDSSQAPEPATLLLFGTGLAGLAGIIRSKKH